MDGAVYNAQEISFHMPSEHKINGETFPLEMQIVHQGQSIGDTAKNVIVSFLFKRSPGVYNKFLEQLDVFNLPNPLDKFRDLEKDLFIPDVLFNVNEESPASMTSFSFYTYEGSLTRPPCAEKTIHYVASDPIGLSSTVIELFKESLRIPDLIDNSGAKLVNDNSIMWSNRKTQPLHGRSVFFFDSRKYGCPTPKKMRRGSGQVGTHGHYERKTSTVEQFFQVDGDQPSGMPGAFVVTENEAKQNEHELPDETSKLLQDNDDDENKSPLGSPRTKEDDDDDDDDAREAI